MIVSFHPLFEGDKNITCAGREPGAEDLAAIQAAKAVILPQGCYQSLYEMARANCPYIFPNYDTRFQYPGKIGQIKLFREFNVAHPASEIYLNLASFHPKFGKQSSSDRLKFPFVFKMDWGGEGETVYLTNSAEDLDEILQKAAAYEKSGQSGFLLQEYIACRNRTLRVVVIGQRVISYWRVQINDGGFYSNLGKGAVIDAEGDPEQQHKAVALVKQICHKTGINLAGFDVIFSSKNDDPDPMLLEINYFFGRKGLGGSEAYYRVLLEEIQTWIHMKRKPHIQPFAYDLGEDDLKRERHKARALRESQWWKRRLAKGVCHYCGRATSPQDLTMDHVVPIARGGKSTKGNVVPCCKECNNAKKQLLPMEWEQYLKQFNQF